MGYKFLEHVTDAIVEVNARDLDEAFSASADAVINLTLDQDRVEESEERSISASGMDLRYLLFNWIEEISFMMITEGFAIRRVVPETHGGDSWRIDARVFGEALDVRKHGFRVEVKAPTFHDMEIRQDDGVLMRFLLDL